MPDVPSSITDTIWGQFLMVVIIVGRLVREGWRRFQWNGRPNRKV